MLKDLLCFSLSSWVKLWRQIYAIGQNFQTFNPVEEKERDRWAQSLSLFPPPPLSHTHTHTLIKASSVANQSLSSSWIPEQEAHFNQTLTRKHTYEIWMSYEKLWASLSDEPINKTDACYVDGEAATHVSTHNHLKNTVLPMSVLL